MKNYLLNIILLSIGLFISMNAFSQATTTSISKGLGVFVFPTEGQSQEQIDKDEMECYKWAKNQTGFDPLNPTEVQAAQVETGPDGAAVAGAARGAAAGAAIGAIAGDTGKGAAIGATAGAVRGRRAKRYGDAKQQQANNQAAEGAEKKMMDDYIKAFSVCMEAKNYSVK